MAENASFVSSGSRRFNPRVILSILLLTGLLAGLIGYKAKGGLKRFDQLRATGSLPIHTEALHPPARDEERHERRGARGHLSTTFGHTVRPGTS